MTRRRNLRVLPMQALLDAKAEAGTMACDPDAALCACVLARAAGWRSGAAVLRRFSAEQVVRLTEEYLRLCAQRQTPLDELLTTLRRSPLERLRWRLSRLLGLMPTDASLRALSVDDLRFCAAQLLLDAEDARVEAVNPDFDESRFRRQRGGGV